MAFVHWRVGGLVVVLVLLSLSVLGHEENELPAEGSRWADPVPYVTISGFLLLVLALIALVKGVNLRERQKRVLFSCMAIPVVLSSLFLASDTIYKTVTSVGGGPVHWQAEYQVWVCGEKLPVHGDGKVHVKGVVHDVLDATLAEFFLGIGGELHNDHLAYPVQSKGVLEFTNGDSCPDDLPGYLQVYVNGKRLPKPEFYVIAPEEQVPPGDCIIVEFGAASRETTQRLCESWSSAGVGYEGGKTGG